MLRIGEFSKLAKITIKALRYYDKIGLLKPSMIDASSSYRYYSDEQLETAHRISLYKSAGFSNETILLLINQSEKEQALLEYQRELLTQRVEEIKKSINFIDDMLDSTKRQKYTAELKKIESRLVCCFRGYISNVEGINAFIKNCLGELRRTNPEVKFAEPDYCCIIYPDEGYRESNVFVEYAQSVDRFGKDTENLQFKEIEEISAVSVLHRGSYDTLRDAYLFAVNWARENGYELVGEPRERYISGAWNRDNVSEWLTELQLPVLCKSAQNEK